MARCGPRYENTRCGEQCLDRMTGRPTTKRNGGPNIRRDPMLSIRDGGERGRDRAPVNIVSPQELRPAETGTTATTGTIDNMVVGNSPVQSNLCALQLALSAVVGEQSHKDSVHRTFPLPKTNYNNNYPNTCGLHVVARPDTLPSGYGSCGL